MKGYEAKRLSDRTVDAVVGKVVDPDIGAAKRSAWSKEEEEIVLKHHGTMSVKELQRKYLPNRTISAIQWKVHDLDVTSRKVLPWSENEDKIVLKRYGTMPVKELQKKYLPNRSASAIMSRALSLGVASTQDSVWPKEEDEIVLENYHKMSIKELQRKYLPNRTISAIQRRASNLGVASRKALPWSENEDKIVLKRYGTMPVKELQEKYLPNKSVQAIRTRAHRLGVASKSNLAKANEEHEFGTAATDPTTALLSTTHSSTPFSDWLAQNIGLPENSIIAYSDAVGTISKEMYQKGTTQKPLENMSPFELDLAIFLIISDTDFAIKNTREKHMYSNALKQYRYFLNTTAEDSGDHAYMEMIENDRQIPETEKEAIIQSRIGQGRFRKELIDKYNGRCIITGIDHPNLLVASHIKPWAASSNKERLSVNNGLLLSATYDRLFDKGLITFDSDGKIFLSSLIGNENIKRLGLSQGMRFNLQINESMKEYLSYHRDELFVE